MSVTLVEAAKYSNDVLLQGVVETMVEDDPILQRLKFKTIVGNALTYNRETTEDEADFYGVNEDWNMTNQLVTPYSVTLKIMGSAAELDDFLRTTRSDINDLRAELVAGKSKAVAKKFGTSLIYGNATSNAKSFDGLHVLIADTTYNTYLADSGDTQTVVLSCSGHIDRILDMPKGRKVDGLFMSKGLRRGLTKYLRSVASISTDRDEFGNLVDFYGKTPIYASDRILDTELTSSGAFSASTGGLTTSIFALSFAEKGVEGIQAKALEVVPWAPVPGTNKEWCQIRWYPAVMMQSLISCAKVVGIDADGTVAA